MCGIFGFTSPKVKNAAEFHRFANRLFEGASIRGRDASGFAAIGDNTYIADKRPLASGTFVKTSQEWRNLREVKSVALIGHTRAATQGDPIHNKNNHPFHGPRYSMAHNGCVIGYREIARDKGIRLQTDCDSEILLHYLERRSDIRDGIIDIFSELSLTAYLAVCALERSTGIIHLFRTDDAPCFIMTVPRWNATVFASTVPILVDAASRVLSRTWNDVAANVEVPFDGQMPAFQHIKLMPDGRITAANLAPHIKFSRKYATGRGFGGMLGVMNGGRSQFEARKDEEEKKKEEKKEDKPSVSDFTYHQVDLENVNSGDTTVDMDAWSCQKCRKPLAGQSCISVENKKRLDAQTGKPTRILICKACWSKMPASTVVKASDTAAPPAASSSKLNRTTSYAELRSILPSLLKNNSNPVGVLEKMREPLLDHQLDQPSMATLMRYNSMSTDQKLQDWADTSEDRIREMDEGEYLAYIDFLKQGLVMA